MGIDFSISGKNGTCLKVAEHEGHFNLMEFLRGFFFFFDYNIFLVNILKLYYSEWETEHLTPTGVVIPPATHCTYLSFIIYFKFHINHIVFFL